MMHVLRTLGRYLDAISIAGLFAAAGLLAVIVVSTCADVLLRYFVNRPTEWVTDSVGFFLCAAIFLAIPDLARRRSHVAITILSESLSAASKEKLNLLIGLTAALACLVAAWITGAETARQFARGIYTVGTFTVPKWWVSAFIVTGFVLTGLQFLRQVFVTRDGGTGAVGEIR